jgi:hypothetical protein
MSYVHRIWTTATPTHHRIMQVTLVALLACAATVALLAYNNQQPLRTQPAAPEIALLRNEASLPDVYWDAFRPEAPAIARPQADTSHPNAYWDLMKPAAPEMTRPQADASQRDHYWDSFRLNNED